MEGYHRRYTYEVAQRIQSTKNVLVKPGLQYLTPDDVENRMFMSEEYELQHNEWVREKYLNYAWSMRWHLEYFQKTDDLIILAKLYLDSKNY